MQPNRATCVASLKLLGDYWTLRIVDTLRDGELRFCEIQRGADGINPVTLTSKLKKMEKAGLIERKNRTLDKISVSYRLTSVGMKILPIIAEVNKFSVATNIG